MGAFLNDDHGGDSRPRLSHQAAVMDNQPGLSGLPSNCIDEGFGSFNATGHQIAPFMVQAEPDCGWSRSSNNDKQRSWRGLVDDFRTLSGRSSFLSLKIS